MAFVLIKISWKLVIIIIIVDLFLILLDLLFCFSTYILESWGVISDADLAPVT
jgi:hypothetical protein